MTGPHRWDRPAQVGLGAALAASVMLGLSLWSSLRTDDAAVAAPDAAQAVEMRAPLTQSAADTGLLRDAVAHDPFRPDRSRAQARYVPPDERRPVAPPRPRQRDPLANLRLVGTAAEGGAGAIAIIAGLGRTPRVLRVGDAAVDGWRLVRVEGGTAMLEHPDSTVVVRVTRTGVTRSRP